MRLRLKKIVIADDWPPYSFDCVKQYFKLVVLKKIYFTLKIMLDNKRKIITFAFNLCNSKKFLKTQIADGCLPYIDSFDCVKHIFKFFFWIIICFKPYYVFFNNERFLNIVIEMQRKSKTYLRFKTNVRQRKKNHYSRA